MFLNTVYQQSARIELNTQEMPRKIQKLGKKIKRNEGIERKDRRKKGK